MHGFEIGDEVKVVEAGQDCSGVVRSIQDKLKLIDVQIYQPGHLKHGLIVSFPPDQVELVKEQDDPGEEKKGKKSKPAEAV